MNMNSQTLKGPLFILGKPRSGTKLLARILSQHPHMALSVWETIFIPYFLNRPKLIKNLADKNEFKKFYDTVLKTPFFFYVAQKDEVLDWEGWYNLCQEYSFYGVLTALLKHYSGQTDNDLAIPGDKSNNYVTSVPLLKEEFPEAKFIHIVRDVRDACLSSRHAWNTNLKRYAQRWNDDTIKCSDDLAKLDPNDYIETRFEELLVNPKSVITRCLNLVQFDFFEKILELNQQSEGVGSARGLKVIKNDNFGKYKTQLSTVEIESLERIAKPALERYDYEISYKGKCKPLSKPELFFYKCVDVSNRINFDIRKGEGTLTGTIKGMLNHRFR